MYEHFFALKQKPFALTSSASFLYLSPKHQAALDALTYGINERVGFIELTGEVGTGKTTLCRTLLNQMDSHTKSAYIFNSSLNGTELLQTILEDLGIKSTKKNKGALYSDLNRFLIDQLAQNNNVVIIIDEAQNLSSSVLEQVRMLSNLEAENKKLLQIILCGQPELREKLLHKNLRQLKQRIAVRCRIEPLSREEVAEYIAHRLQLAGTSNLSPVFDASAIDEIFRHSQGIPRVINILCDKALLLAYIKEERFITHNCICECIREIEGGH